MNLRVALEAGSLLDAPTGVGRYTRELARGLEIHGVDVTKFAVALKGASTPDVKRWRLPSRVVHRAWLKTGRPSVARLIGDVDVVHGTNFVLPVAGSAPGVVTIHDLSFLRDDAFPGAAGWRDMVPWSLKRARRAIAPSNAMAEEISDHYGISTDYITVTYEGVAPVFFGATPLSDASLEAMGISRPFAVAVGTIEPRKNLARLLEAWRRAAPQVSGWTLVLAGPRGWGPGLPRTEGVVLTGWIGDETLPGLLAAADLFCYPSLYEGFGLPPLEAMAAGTAAVVGNYPAASEVLGDAALRVDPGDIDAIGEALGGIVANESLRRGYALAGKAHAVSYTWERTARATIGAYEAARGR
ncbi:MAG: glycosyltransferase family 4 protein [Actinomycetota bacterium]